MPIKNLIVFYNIKSMSTAKEIGASKKITNYILFVIFALFAFLQLNDPDGILWFAIYLCVAVVCLLNNFINISKPIILLIGVLLLVYSAFHFSLFIDYLNATVACH